VVWISERHAAATGALCRLARRPGCRRPRIVGSRRARGAWRDGSSNW